MTDKFKSLLSRKAPAKPPRAKTINPTIVRTKTAADDFAALLATNANIPDQPAVDQPAVDQPAVDQPAVDQPAVDQPALRPQLHITEKAARLIKGDPRFNLYIDQNGTRIIDVQAQTPANPPECRIQTLLDDPGYCRVFFTSIPPVEIRTELLDHGYRWDRYKKCWVGAIEDAPPRYHNELGLNYA